MTTQRAVIKKIAQSFSGGRWLRGYIQGKLTADPVFDTALTAVQGTSGMIVDLGCGLGLLGLFLYFHGHDAKYRGCDLGGWKIIAGINASNRLGHQLDLQQGNLLNFPLDNAEIICAFDILHYLPKREQEFLIRRLASAARNGSTVLIRNGVRGCGWRSIMTLLEEWWTRMTGWIQGGTINFPELKHLISTFEKERCQVETKPLWGKTPFSSYWLRVSSQH
jgi:SAM-dependent methyltransferase